jgi:tetratricopeptide (TPR) repeat protein
MALKFYDKALKIWEELGNKSAQARIINNSGSTLYYKGSIDKAIEYKIRALNIRESLSDSLGIAYSLSSLGQLYIYQGQNEKALESFSTAHELGMRMGNKRLIGMNHKMFGWFYYYTGKYHKAIEHLESSLELLKEIPNMNESILFSTGFLFHSYKILGKDFDKNKLKNRIEKAGDDRDSSLNFILYVLLQEIRYLEIAYDQVMEMAELMDDIFREEFLKHPDSKKIIEEYKKIVS